MRREGLIEKRAGRYERDGILSRDREQPPPEVVRHHLQGVPGITVHPLEEIFGRPLTIKEQI